MVVETQNLPFSQVLGLGRVSSSLRQEDQEKVHVVSQGHLKSNWDLSTA